jgi:uncharacterized membrane protein
MPYKRLIIGVVLVILGIALVIYANHHEPQPVVEQTKDWLDKVGDFFKNLWGKIARHQEEVPPPPRFSPNAITSMIAGILLILGGGVLIFRDLKRHLR